MSFSTNDAVNAIFWGFLVLMFAVGYFCGRQR
jgi:hypothetical protein